MVIISKYESFNGKSYVEAKTYDELLYELKRANDKIENQKKTMRDMQSHIDCLKSELLEVQSCTRERKTELPVEPIDVAKVLISETVMLKANSINKIFNPNIPDEYEIDKYSKSDLRQIAEHLLVYCNNQKDGD